MQNGKRQIVKLWLKAFIPRDLDGTAPVSGTGSHSGKTMLLTPGPIDACFLTDQRGFSSDIDAHARMHSEIEIDLQTGQVVNELHKCYETIEVDCDNGREKCRRTADTSGMKFSNIQVSPEGAVSIDLSGSTHNPCLKVVNIPVSPNLDYNGTISIVPLDEGVSIAFKGYIETYPAFEMYASINGGPAQTVFQEPVVPGTNPVNLAGPPTRAISHQIKAR